MTLTVRQQRLLRRTTLTGLVLAFLAVQAVTAGTLWIRSEAAGHVFAEADVPPAPVALVLGAAVDASGVPSPFLAARLEIARRLFVAGKVKAILVSGDHARWEYDEPGAMTTWLTQHGVPAERIAQDHAGFDTYDSCVRAKKVFGVDRLTVVTQTYHLDRAVTLCRRVGVDAAGVGDDTVKVYRRPWLISSTREYGAMLKAVADVGSGRDPIFLGRHETTVEDAVRLG